MLYKVIEDLEPIPGALHGTQGLILDVMRSITVHNTFTYGVISAYSYIVFER